MAGTVGSAPVRLQGRESGREYTSTKGPYPPHLREGRGSTFVADHAGGWEPTATIIRQSVIEYTPEQPVKLA